MNNDAKLKEIWKPIKGFEGYYEVSNKGRVKSLSRIVYDAGTAKTRKTKEIILKLQLRKKGYLYVNLNKNSKHKAIGVHRLVAYAFISNPENKPQVNHINENKTDNTVNNLEWCTAKENLHHSKLKPVYQLNSNLVIIKKWKSASHAQKKGFNASRIGICCRNIKATHLGYKWKFAI